MIQPFLGHHHRLLLCRPTTTKRELSWVLMVGAHWFGKGKDYHLLVILLLLLPYLLCLGLGVCVHWFLEIEEQGKQSGRELGKGGGRGLGLEKGLRECKKRRISKKNRYCINMTVYYCNYHLLFCCFIFLLQGALNSFYNQ